MDDSWGDAGLQEDLVSGGESDDVLADIHESEVEVKDGNDAGSVPSGNRGAPWQRPGRPGQWQCWW